MVPGSNVPLSVATAGLLEVAEDAIITVDVERNIVLFNRGAEKIFGYQRGEVVGKKLEILLPERFRLAHVQQVRNFAEGPTIARLMGERRNVYGLRKDGTEFPADVSISKMHVQDTLYLTAIVRDVSERYRAEQAIRQLNAELEQRVIERTAALAETNRQLLLKSQENETFVYSVSHDLRSPLVNLEGFSKELRLTAEELRELLSDPSVPASIRSQAERLITVDMFESLGFIEAAVARLGRIIDALLRLSRLGRVEYHWQWVDVHDLVTRIVSALQASLSQKSAEVRIITDLPQAWGDPTALEQVFGNLIGNAVKYLEPSRAGLVEIGYQPAQETSPGAYFVRDNGMGIAGNHLPQLFRAFQRLHPQVAEGEGMGLAIVHRIVERHGGKIWVDSQLGVGTTFYVSLPPPPENERGVR
jgi:PAS domain S-box-containing protein